MIVTLLVEDPGFPEAERTSTLWGAPTPNTATFHKICMSNSKNWYPYGACAGVPPGPTTDFGFTVLRQNFLDLNFYTFIVSDCTAEP